MKITLLLVLILALAGCSTVDLAARGVNAYCASATGFERMALRERLALATYPHRLEIECN